MHPQNTQDQAPADAVERAARVIADETDEPMWSAVVIARATLAAALPPTTTEWGVRYEVDRDTEVHEARESEAEARAEVAASPTDKALVSREVTDWREVTP